MQVLRPERELKRLFPREDLIEQLPKFNVDLLLISILPRICGFASADLFEQLHQ